MNLFFWHSRKPEPHTAIFVLSEKIQNRLNNCGGVLLKKEICLKQPARSGIKGGHWILISSLLSDFSHGDCIKALLLQSNAVSQNSAPKGPVDTTHKTYRKNKQMFEQRCLNIHFKQRSSYSIVLHVEGKAKRF